MDGEGKDGAEGDDGDCDVDNDDGDYDDDDDDYDFVVDNDDIYIMMKCVSVCHEKWSLPPRSLL